MEDNDQIMKDSNYSVAIPKPDGYNLRGLQWTTEPPTAAGNYWVYHADYPHNGTYVVEVYDREGVLSVGDDWDFAVEVAKYGTHWLGPLPVPELPKGE